jgi:hypothetical protein
MSTGPPPRGLAGADEHIRWCRGDLRVRTAENVVFMQLNGYLDKEYVTNITQPVDKLIVAGVKPLIFNDWWEMTGYDTDARLKLTDWIFWMRGKIQGSHILVRSKIVSMGVSIANLALGGMLTVYTDRQEFALAYRRAVRSCVKPPSSESDSQRNPPRTQR